MPLLVMLPLPGATITQDTIDELRKRGVIPVDVIAFHAIESYAAALGGSLTTLPVAASKPKRWADRSSAPAEYITVEGSLDTSQSSTWSDFTMTVVGRTIANFWQERAFAKDQAFARIPRLVTYSVGVDSFNMNLLADYGRKVGPRTVDTAEAPYPLAKSAPNTVNGWTWPTNHAMRFNPTTGLVEVFDYQEYGVTFPIVTTVSVGGGGTGTIRVKGMSDESFLQASAGAIFGEGTPAARVAKIIGNLEVK